MDAVEREVLPAFLHPALDGLAAVVIPLAALIGRNMTLQIAPILRIALRALRGKCQFKTAHRDLTFSDLA